MSCPAPKAGKRTAISHSALADSSYASPAVPWVARSSVRAGIAWSNSSGVILGELTAAAPAGPRDVAAHTYMPSYSSQVIVSQRLPRTARDCPRGRRAMLAAQAGCVVRRRSSSSRLEAGLGNPAHVSLSNSTLHTRQCYQPAACQPQRCRRGGDLPCEGEAETEDDPARHCTTYYVDYHMVPLEWRTLPQLDRPKLSHSRHRLQLESRS
jgi:hypothetical protein